jgi:hypothetical protein
VHYDRHQKRLMNEYIRYYHGDRTHHGLDKQTPAAREKPKDASTNCKVISLPQPGGFHHRYQLAA